MLRTPAALEAPCPGCAKQSVDAAASRSVDGGYWELTADVPVCAYCSQSRLGETERVTIRVTASEKDKVQGVYRRNLAAGAKLAVTLGNLETTTQRAVEAKDPLIKDAIVGFLPYLTTEKFAASRCANTWPRAHWVRTHIAVCAAALAGLKLAKARRKYYVGLGLASVAYAYINQSCELRKPYSERWVQDCGGPVTEEEGAVEDGEEETLTNHPDDPPITSEPQGELTVGDIVHGNLPDGTQAERPRGRVIAEPSVPIVLHEDCPGNIQRAIDERITKKQRKPSMTQTDKDQIKFAAKKFATTVFTEEAIQEAMLSMGSLEDCKSKKWTSARFDQAYLQALNGTSEQFTLKCSVKNEPLPQGKAPRMIVADGDPGQVMALGLLWVMEHVLFDRYIDRSVKHTGKAEAMNRVLRSLDMDRKYSVVEADGSAWDTCCNKEVRDLTENAVMDQIWLVMQKFCADDVGFEERHRNTNTTAYLRLLKTCAAMKADVVFVIDAIRRSGHRGTSVLNWLINHILTLVSVNPTSEGKLLLTKGHRFKDRWNGIRHARFAHEGDDTLYTISPPLKDKEVQDIIAFWERCGFNMKLFVKTRVAEFTGWKIPILNGRLQVDQATPDFLRNITNGCVTCSREALDGDYRQVAASKFASYALSYANTLPTVSEMFKNWAEDYGFKGQFTDDDIRGFGGVKPDTLLGLYGVTPEDEEQTLGNLGILRNMSYDDFTAHVLSQRYDMPNGWIGGLSYWE